MSIERLRALVQSWREIADKHDARAERLNESGDASDAAWCEAAAEHRSYCADELATLIAELGQEVGAEQIGWVREVTWVDGRNMTIYENEPKPLVNPMAGFVSQRIVPVFTSPAHTSEARDAARYRWLRDQNSITESPDAWTITRCDFADIEDPARYWVGTDLDAAIDAAMRQEGE